jgi:pseudaminic acid cytidylyltransferase
MTSIAIIPARGGSKRIKRKNIREFLGTPAIENTIEVIRNTNLFDRIIVSTEDIEIRNIALNCGAEVIERSMDLADDYSTSLSVISHTLRCLKSSEEYAADYVCCVYPVTPMLSILRLKEAYELLRSSDYDFVFTAKKFESSPLRSLRIGNDGKSEMHQPNFVNTRTQDLPDFFHDAAMFYFGKYAAWVQEQPILNGNSRFLVLDKYETIDIDDEEDWLMAENIQSIRAHKMGLNQRNE